MQLKQYIRRVVMAKQSASGYGYDPVLLLSLLSPIKLIKILKSEARFSHSSAPFLSVQN